MIAITCQNLSKKYQNRKSVNKALDQVDFSVRKGEIFGFLGPNGAGKSTTIKILFNFLKPSSGTLLVNGLDVQNQEFRQKIGYLPEIPFLYNHLTAEETLLFSGKLSGCSNDYLYERIPELLKRMELSHVITQRVSSFSKGMKQRLGIANALIHDPEILVLDEPMSGLDPLGRHMIKELIRELQLNGKTIFFSSHILSDIEELCDSIAIINKGKILYSGGMREFVDGTNGFLEEIFVRLIREHNATLK